NRSRGTFYFRPVEKLIYHRYDKIISISKQTQDALQQWLQATDEKFVVINNGVDMRHFSLIHRPITPKSLIMVSRFTASKDQETVIRAMQYIDKEATLRLVGDGDSLEHCKQVAKECRVEDRVKFLGTRSDVADLIAESYIGIQSSNWEGFGLTAVEMMACGKPVIATDVDGLKQVVEGAGLIFHRGDAAGLAKCVNDLLKDNYKYNAISNLCILRAADYDISKMSNSYINEYNKLF
ncbi:MAG: glycosyltransferase family 4 protein, partial [Prevotella sp.]|nr:glycosyltransferase family 4 protein [Prevotella sp.]